MSDPADRNPIGTHVLVGKGLVDGAVANADQVGCETYQIFVGNPRGWALSPGKPAEDERFRDLMAERGTRTFIHAPYLVNLGSPRIGLGGMSRRVAERLSALLSAAERPVHLLPRPSTQ